MQKVQNHAPISPFSSRISRFIGSFREKGHTYGTTANNEVRPIGVDFSSEQGGKPDTVWYSVEDRGRKSGKKDAPR